MKTANKKAKQMLAWLSLWHHMIAYFISVIFHASKD